MKFKLMLFMFLSCLNISASGQTTGPAADFLYAKRLYLDSMFDLAAKQFHEYSENNPDSPQAFEALMLAGDSYFKINQFEEARREYVYLMLKYPDAKGLDEVQYKIGECFKAEKLYLRAALSFQQVKVLYPKSQLAEKSLIEAVKMFVLGKDYGTAIETLYSFFDDFPSSPSMLEMRLELAKSFRLQGEWQRSLVEIDRIFEITQRGQVRALASLLKAEIAEELGKSKEAEDIYLSLISEYKDFKPIFENAVFRLAVLYRNKGQYAQSNQYLKNLQIDEVKLSGADLLMGDNYFDLGNCASALTQYQKVARLSDTLSTSLIFKIGKTQERLGNHQVAIEWYEKMIGDCNDASCADAYFGIARCYSKAGLPQVALKYYQTYLNAFPGSPCEDRVRYRMARVQETELTNYDRAIRLYSDLTELFPRSQRVDEAQLGIARCYEKLENYALAVKEYQRYLKTYPGAKSYDEVSRKVDYLNRFAKTQDRGALNSLAALIGDVSDDPKINYRLALTYYHDFKDYARAMVQLKGCLNQASENVPQDELLYYLANSYHLLGEKEQPHRSAYLDSAQTLYARLLSEYSQSQWCDDATLNLMRAKLMASVDSSVNTDRIYLEFLPNFISMYPESPYVDDAYYHVAIAHLHENPADSANSIPFFEKVIADFPNSTYSDRALFGKYFVFKNMGKNEQAKETLQRYVDRHPAGREIVRAHFALANLLADQGDYPQALVHLKKIVTDFFYSNYVDSANTKIGVIYSKAHDFLEGIEYFEKMKQPACDVDELEDVEDGREELFWLGQFYQQSGDREKAIRAYLDYLKKYPNSLYSPDVIFSLAELYNGSLQEDRELALNYLSQFIQDFPDHPKHYLANIYLGDILFQKGSYETAREHYLKASEFAMVDSNRFYPGTQAILCRYRLKQPSAADAETKQFRKSYKDIDNYLGQIELARGDYFFEEKLFKEAEETYQSAKSNFKKIEYGARAELALAKLYLTLNRDEDGLKILTDMPKKYAEDEIIPDVYLALGEFYYLKARQVENAMIAYKTAVDHPKVTEKNLSKSMLSLFKCYNDLQMWDRALILARQYLERFPLYAEAFEIRMQIGIIYYNLHEYDLAIQHMMQLKQEANSENEPRIQYWIGDCLMEKGLFQRAITEYLKVKYISKPSKLNWAVTAQYKAGLAYMKLGEMTNAKKVFQKIVLEQGIGSPFGKGAQMKIDEIDNPKN